MNQWEPEVNASNWRRKTRTPDQVVQVVLFLRLIGWAAGESFYTNHGVRWLTATTVSGNETCLPLEGGARPDPREQRKSSLITECCKKIRSSKDILHTGICDGRTNCLTVSKFCYCMLTNFVNPLSNWKHVSFHQKILQTCLITCDHLWRSHHFSIKLLSTARLEWLVFFKTPGVLLLKALFNYFFYSN